MPVRLQYVSYCNDERYKDHLAPAVKAFWDEVTQPFGSRALQNLDLSHVVGKAMHPNRAAKIPDYGVQDHIALVCGPLLWDGRGAVHNMRPGSVDRRRSVAMQVPWAVTAVFLWSQKSL